MLRRQGHLCPTAASAFTAALVGPTQHDRQPFAVIQTTTQSKRCASSGGAAASAVASGMGRLGVRPFPSVAAAKTVPFAREKLLTISSRTAEFFGERERAALTALRGAILPLESGPDATVPTQRLWWSQPRVDKVVNAAALAASLGTAAVQTTAPHAGAPSAMAEVLSTVRGVLQLRSNYGLVLTDQLLVAALVVACRDVLVEYPSVWALEADGHYGEVEPQERPPAADTTPLCAQAALDVLRVLSDDHRVPAHPLLLVAVTALARSLAAQLDAGYRLFGAGRGVDTDRVSPLQWPHLPPAARDVMHQQVLPLVALLGDLDVLVGVRGDDNAGRVRAYFGGGQATSAVDCAFAGPNKTIDLVALLGATLEVGTPVFRTAPSSAHVPRPLSALELAAKSANAFTPLQSPPVSAPAPASNPVGMAGSGLTSARELHLRLLIALAEVAIGSGALPLVRIVCQTLFAVHADLFDPSTAPPPSPQAQAVQDLADHLLTLIAHAVCLADYIGVSARLSEQGTNAAPPTPWTLFAGLGAAHENAAPFFAAVRSEDSATMAAFQERFPKGLRFWRLLCGVDTKAVADNAGVDGAMDRASTTAQHFQLRVRAQAEAEGTAAFGAIAGLVEACGGLRLRLDLAELSSARTTLVAHQQATLVERPLCAVLLGDVLPAAATALRTLDANSALAEAASFEAVELRDVAVGSILRGVVGAWDALVLPPPGPDGAVIPALDYAGQCGDEQVGAALTLTFVDTLVDLAGAVESLARDTTAAGVHALDMLLILARRLAATADTLLVSDAATVALFNAVRNGATAASESNTGADASTEAPSPALTNDLKAKASAAPVDEDFDMDDIFADGAGPSAAVDEDQITTTPEATSVAESTAGTPSSQDQDVPVAVAEQRRRRAQAAARLLATAEVIVSIVGERLLTATTSAAGDVRPLLLLGRLVLSAQAIERAAAAFSTTVGAVDCELGHVVVRVAGPVATALFPLQTYAAPVDPAAPLMTDRDIDEAPRPPHMTAGGPISDPSAVPVADAFGEEGSFAALFDAARRDGATDLCLALRALRPSLFF